MNHTIFWCFYGMIGFGTWVWENEPGYRISAIILGIFWPTIVGTVLAKELDKGTI